MTAESGQSSNRLFIIIAVALIGLICIGLMGLSGVLFVLQANRAQEAAALQVAETPTSFPPTFTPTPTATFTPTDTPEPTPTATMVIQTPTPGGAEEASVVSGQAVASETPLTEAESNPEATPVVVDAEAGDSTPTPAVVPGSGGVLSTSSGGVVAAMGGFVLLLLVVAGVVYRHRAL